jgi:hypothetical protein
MTTASLDPLWSSQAANDAEAICEG